MFVIKGTYKHGENRGKYFYLGKAGIYIAAVNITNINQLQVYESLRTARMVATRFNQRNNLDEKYHPEFTIPIQYTAIQIKSTT